MVETLTTEHLEFVMEEAIPLLLELPLDDEEWAQWWEEEADPLETYQATYKAIQYHLSTSFGKGTVESVKKSLAAEDGAAEGKEEVSE